MPANNFKLFDENKQNMLSDQEYQASQQRLGGVQAGIASSMLNNKFAYQMSLIAYAIAQMMNANGYDATDALAVSAFVGNLSNSVLQKVIDKATTAEAQAGTNTLKWMTPALVKSFFDYRLATQAEAQAGSIDTKWMSPAKVKAFYNYWKATASEATEGTNDTKWMSPLKVAQVVAPVVNASWVLLNEYTIAGSYIWTAPDLFNGRDYTIGVMVIGGGAGGTAGASYVGDGAEVSGGPSGRSNYAVVKVSPNSNHTLVIGAGGEGATANRSGSGQSFSRGGNGGTTSFDGALSALGGGYSTLSTQADLFGGQLPCYLISADTASLNFFGGVTISGLVNRYYSKDTSAMTMDIMSCYNPFEHRRILGAGGFAISNSSSWVSGVGGKDPLTGLGATDGVATKIQTSGAAVVSGAPTAPGCGGGGAACYSSTAGTAASATSGAGADGAVMIYVMGVEA